jgi:cellulose synthase/poly-beta-1,6-N-acetylglucosamine synthase-like glycosyltransferase
MEVSRLTMSLASTTAPVETIYPPHGPAPSPKTSNLTVIVPAYNECQTIADTVRSLQAQTILPKEIIVVDDCSTDGTGDIARALCVRVLRPPANTGSKAGAQTAALAQIDTEFTLAIDADTTLAPDAIEKLLAAFEDPHIASACGFVIPRFVNTLWERGRYAEYLLAFTWYKPVQDYYRKPLICSGCFSMYRTSALKQMGGWRSRTLAEDMDLTWSLYKNGFGVRFIPEAVCYPIEPHDFGFMSKQLRRWSHGFLQNYLLHWRDLLDVPYLRVFVMVAMWDALFASLAFILLIPILAVLLMMPSLLLAYFIDIPIILIPIILTARTRNEVRKALLSVPCFLLLRLANSWFMLEAFATEMVMGKSFHTYQKGH